MTKANGWDIHEDTFEEKLRRELVEHKKLVLLLQTDLQKLTEAYYAVIKENEQLKKRH